MSEDPVIRELSAAVERSPDVIELRLHLASLLADRGRYAEALGHCSAALTREAGNADALSLLQRCSAALAAPPANRSRRRRKSPPPKTASTGPVAEKEVADIVAARV